MSVSLWARSVASAPNVSYPAVSKGGLFGLSGGETQYFALRLSGERKLSTTSTLCDTTREAGELSRRAVRCCAPAMDVGADSSQVCNVRLPKTVIRLCLTSANDVLRVSWLMVTCD